MSATEIAEQVFRKLGDPGTPGEALRLVAVPGNAQTRWLLPAGAREIGSVLASWSPYRAWPRLAWRAVRAASGLKRTADLPFVVEMQVDGVGTAQWESLGWRWQDTPIPVVYVGTPGPRRKAVVHLVERTTGKCRAVVKVPLTEQAKAVVLREAEVLETLEREHYRLAPRLLQADWARGTATQTFVEGRSGERKLAAEHWTLLRTLRLPGTTTSLATHADRWCCGGGESWAASELHDDSPLPACWEHGDFAPWNIRQRADGTCALVDWESARRSGLPLMDAFHFLQMQDFLFGEKPRVHGARLWNEAQAMGIAAQTVRKLEIAYLLIVAVECARSGNHRRLRFVRSTLELVRERAA